MTKALAAVTVLIGGLVPVAATETTAQQPSLTVQEVADSSHRPLVTVAGLLEDDALEEAARSGLPLRVRVHVELWKDGWIDDLVQSQSWTAILRYEPLDQEYLVHTNPAPQRTQRFPSYAAARGVIEGARLLAMHPREEGRYYYIATLELETFSLSDLAELERWLQGELQPAVTGGRSLPGAVGEGAKRLMIRLLRLPARKLEARSERFRIDG
ncbi:MAG: DUF4390 domain-containing protein [Longimicrobiales bacterium]